ncbi:uncharacterized protein PV09_07486 [Verruconis gallopava]|uniref:F-box domain-containing protein n=1 Tax=Verruconis gallopava TaxID=253628 RepID=A0A0D2APB4_9PEZI|nr:uncharacterized protein PV09_07486 [Verruconis gallopava]KIW00964.1 hypothetical protein PV09_07486 [Verruconis gallopava]
MRIMVRKGGPTRPGEQKMVDISRKRQRQARPNLRVPGQSTSPSSHTPSSHYEHLSIQQKKQIRPFVFLDLPGEIRNMIYAYLLQPKRYLAAGPIPFPSSREWDSNSGAVGSGRVLLQCNPIDNSLVPMRAYGYGYPDLRVMRLSKAVNAEAMQFFHHKHHFEVFVRVGHQSFVPSLSSNFRIDFVRDLRLLFVINECCCSIGFDTSIDLGPLLGLAISLRAIRIAIQLCGQSTIKSTPSAFLIGFVAQIINSVPPKVDILWENWKGHGKVGSQAWPDELWHFAPVDVDVSTLEMIAKRWLRG